MALTQEQKAAAYDKAMASRKEYNEKRRMRIKLLLAKAAKAGIKVTDAEVKALVK